MTLPCGHVCPRLDMKDRGQEGIYKCTRDCEGWLMCGHPCSVKGGKHGCSKHRVCRQKCGHLLRCGFPCSLRCHYPSACYMECPNCRKIPRSPSPSNGTISQNALITCNHFGSDHMKFQMCPDDSLSSPSPSTDDNSFLKDFTSTGSAEDHFLESVKDTDDQHLHESGDGGDVVTCGGKVAHTPFAPGNQNFLLEPPFLHSAELCSEAAEYVDVKQPHELHRDQSFVAYEEKRRYNPFALDDGNFSYESTPTDSAELCSLKAETVGVKQPHESCGGKCGYILPCGHSCSLFHHHLLPQQMKCSFCDLIYPSPHPLPYDPDKALDITLTLKRGHICKDKNGQCFKHCKTVLSCGHKCVDICYRHEAHFPQDKCFLCSTVLAVEEELPNSLIDQDTYVLVHCVHQSKMYKCSEVCRGLRLCGHPCGWESELHMCEDHPYFGKCLKRCKASMSCGHSCVKTCHKDDSAHKCAPVFQKPCENALEVSTETTMTDSETIFMKPTHEHRLDGVCKKVCMSVLSCGHTCTLRCELHKSSLHSAHEKCHDCTISDAIWEQFSSVGIRHQRGLPFNHCSHFAKEYNCEQICRGRLCGHSCDLEKPHLCSYHMTFDKVTCQERCKIRLSCHHKCTRICHIGDYAHECKLKFKKSGKLCVNAPKFGQVLNDQHIQTSNSNSAPEKLIDIQDMSTVGNGSEEKSSENHAAKGYCKSSDTPQIDETLNLGRGILESSAQNNLCGVVFPCQHICTKRCHPDSPHNDEETCDFCGDAELSSVSSVLPLDGQGAVFANAERESNAIPPDEQVTDGVLEIAVHECHRVNGVCLQKCDHILLCGHECTLHCHLQPLAESAIHICGQRCQTILSCGHVCGMLCNLHQPVHHNPGDSCECCSFTNTLYRISLPVHRCSHQVNRFECNKVCPGRLCGHPCSFSALHKCSDHAVTKTTRCPVKCNAVLTCGHRCCKCCHPGNDIHRCKTTRNRCVNSVSHFEMDDAGGLNYAIKAKDSAVTTFRRATFNVNRFICRSSDTNQLKRSCDLIFDCGHGCGEFHVGGLPHRSLRKCDFCLASDYLWENFSKWVEKPQEIPSDFCSHFVKRSQCNRNCVYLMCGHTCPRAGERHVCSDHAQHDCQDHTLPCPWPDCPTCHLTCSARLLCGHGCSKRCHVGDYSHVCPIVKCQSKYSISTSN